MSKQGIILTIIAAVLLVGISVGIVMFLEEEKKDDSPAEEMTTKGEETTTEVVIESVLDTSEFPKTPESSDVTEETKHFVSYEEFISMEADDQEAFINTFPTKYDFIKWYNEAEDAYEATRETIEFDGSGDIVLG